MENVESPKTKKNLITYGTVVAFLCLEVLAFLSFTLAHNYILYGCLSLVLAILLFIVTFRQIKKDGIATFAYFVFPLFVFGLLSALSPFVRDSDGAIGIVNGIFIPITLTFVALCGFFVGHIQKFDLQKVFLVIYGALAVFVLINFIATMVYYVPFYTIIYKNSYIFFEGKPSSVPIGQTAYMLFGFEILEVSVEYWCLYPAILLSSCVALFFIKFKDNKIIFLTYLAFTVLAALSLIFTICKSTLVGDLMIILVLAVIIIAIKIKASRKIIKIAMLVLAGLFVFGSLLLFLNAQTNWSFLSSMQNLVKSNQLLNRLFNANRFSSKINGVLWELFNPGKLFGSFVGIVSNEGDGVVQTLTGFWAFDNLLTTGLFGAIFFAFAFVMGIRRMIKFFKNDTTPEINKWLLIAYVTMTFAITFVAHDGTPLINADNLYPIYMFTPFLISLFLLAYTYKPMEKEEEKKEEIEVKEEPLENEKELSI